MLGWVNLFHCEINPFGRKILDYWFPDSKSYEDITNTDFSEWRGKVNVLTGGFPCQPFSYAGQRRGAQDDRYLWPYMFRCIDQIQPDWVIGENVAGILTMVEQGEVTSLASASSLFEEDDNIRGTFQLQETFTLERICSDLESHGYAVQPILVPACAVGAPHRRDRVFIVGRRIASDANKRTDGRDSGEYESPGGEEWLQEWDKVRQLDQSGQIRPESEGYVVPDANCPGREESIQPGRGENQAEDGARLDDRTQRPCPDGPSSHAYCDRGGEVDQHLQPELADGTEPLCNGGERPAAYSHSDGYRTQEESGGVEGCRRSDYGQQGEWGESAKWPERLHQFLRCGRDYPCGERWRNFPTVSPIHRGNDGLPFDVDRLTIPFSRWRNESLKAYGNAIVPQVMYEIFRAIDLIESAHHG